MEQQEQLQRLLVTPEVCRRTCAAPCVFGGMKAIFLTGLPEFRKVGWVSVSATTHWNGRIRVELEMRWCCGSISPWISGSGWWCWDGMGAFLAHVWFLSTNWASLRCNTDVYFQQDNAPCHNSALSLSPGLHSYHSQSSRLFLGAPWWINTTKIGGSVESRWWLDTDLIDLDAAPFAFYFVKCLGKTGV